MSAKWADYLISAVRYNPAGTHIDEVLAHEDRGETVGSGISANRAEVVRALEIGTTFMTIFMGPDSRWIKGASVGTVTIEGEKYIRTDADRTKKDNLDRLPQF